MYPRDVFVRYCGLHRTEAAEVVLLYLNIAECLISGMESGVGRVLRQQSKTFPNTNQHYRLQTESTTNTRTTLYNANTSQTVSRHISQQPGGRLQLCQELCGIEEACNHRSCLHNNFEDVSAWC